MSNHEHEHEHEPETGRESAPKYDAGYCDYLNRRSSAIAWLYRKNRLFLAAYAHESLLSIWSVQV